MNVWLISMKWVASITHSRNNYLLLLVLQSFVSESCRSIHDSGNSINKVSKKELKRHSTHKLIEYNVLKNDWKVAQTPSKLSNTLWHEYF